MTGHSTATTQIDKTVAVLYHVMQATDVIGHIFVMKIQNNEIG